MTLKLKPIADRIVLKGVDVEEKTETGIILVSDKKEKPNTGEIVAIGDGDKVKKLGLKIGDRVIYEKFEGVDYEIYKILDYNQIVAIIK